MHTENVGGVVGHTDDVGTKAAWVLLGHGLECSKHFQRILVLNLIVAGQKGAPAAQLLDEERLLFFLRPLQVAAKTKQLGDFIHKLRMPIRLLPDIKLDHGQTKALEPTNQIQQTARCNDPVTNSRQRPPAEKKGLHQLVYALDEIGGLLLVPLLLVVQQLLVVCACGLQVLPQPNQDVPVGLIVRQLAVAEVQTGLAGIFGRHGASSSHSLPNLLTALGHAQLKQQPVDLLVVQVRSTPLVENQHLLRNLVRNKRVSISVTTNPRAKCDDGGVWGQGGLANSVQGHIHCAHELGQSHPKILLQNSKTASSLVIQCGLDAAHCLRPPNSTDLTAQGIIQVLLLLRGQNRDVTFFDQRCNLLVLCQQCAPQCLRGVCRQHQFNVLVEEGLSDLGWVDPRVLEIQEHVLTRVLKHNLRLTTTV
eukprot:comp23757_c1_seq1/m.41118 comp23757_c1_seq1/g.41118  ORF comp23757_c1_seq1/g.41118 comp23757_c1_seq1/m.41118 type:complete len:421 (+) comp23757_c1_seq1:571-1833(+)